MPLSLHPPHIVRNIRIITLLAFCTHLSSCKSLLCGSIFYSSGKRGNEGTDEWSYKVLKESDTKQTTLYKYIYSADEEVSSIGGLTSN